MALQNQKKWNDAILWFLKASAAGDAVAETMAGDILVLGGNGVTQDKKQGYDLLVSAAKSGELNAASKLAKFEFDGVIKPANPAEIIEWGKKAGSHIDGRGFYIVAQCYKLGIGVDRDDGQYRTWLLKASDALNADAAFDLAVIYANGDGGDKDKKLSQYYLNLAHDRGNHKLLSE